MLERILAGSTDSYWARMAAEPLRATAGEAGEELLCRTFHPSAAANITDWETIAYLRGLVRGGCPQAFDFVQRALEDTSLGGTWFTVVDGKAVSVRKSRADVIAEAVSSWRRGSPRHDPQGEDRARTTHQQELRRWLAEEFGKRKAGKPSQLDAR
jgi:hypothetical protein